MSLAPRTPGTAKPTLMPSKAPHGELRRGRAGWAPAHVGTPNGRAAPAHTAWAAGATDGGNAANESSSDASLRRARGGARRAPARSSTNRTARTAAAVRAGDEAAKLSLGDAATAGDVPEEVDAPHWRWRTPEEPQAPPRAGRAAAEVARFFGVTVALIVQMRASGEPLLAAFTVPLALAALGALVCIFMYQGQPYTLWATPSAFLRRSELGDPLYAVLLPVLLICAYALDAAPSRGPSAELGPPPIGGPGGWHVEYLPGAENAPPVLEGRAKLFEMQLLYAATMALHMGGARAAAALRWDRSKIPAPASFILFSTLVTGVLVAGKALNRDPVLPALALWEVAVASATHQFVLYQWTRVARRNFTLGELGLASAFLGSLIMEAAYMTLWRLAPRRHPLPTFRLPTALIAYQLALVVGMLMMIALLSPLLVLSRFLAQRPTFRLRWPHKRDLHRRLLSLAILVLGTAFVLGVLGLWVRWLLGQRDAWLYALRFTLAGQTWWSRLAIITYWLGVCAGALGVLHALLDSRLGTANKTRLPAQSTVSINARRKYFHLVAVLLFVPPIALDPAFMHLAFSAVLSMFMLCEMIRYCALYPLGAPLHCFLTQFLDEKDTGLVILSHVYLLCGCASGVWVGGRSALVHQLGVLLLGVGDALASIVGRRAGRLRWPGSKKTVEGTAAFVGGIVLATALLRAIGWVAPVHWTRFVGASVLLALLEGVSEQNDNLVLPLTGVLLMSVMRVGG